MFLEFEVVVLKIFYIAHWIIPWLILALGMYILVKFVRGYLDNCAYTNTEHRLFIIFRNLMKIQGVTGLIYFIWSGFVTHSIPVYRISHGITMLVAILILRFGARWKNEADATRYLNNFYVLLASFLIMLVGIALVPSVTGR